MNQEQIERAATEYIHRDKTHGLTRKKAFAAGARWVLDRLCQLPFDEAISELAQYAAGRADAQPGAAYLASRMMRDSLAESADAPGSPDSGELDGKGGAK